MDFDGAIKAHAEWKLKLGSYLRKPDGSLKSDTVAQDNLCALGKWLYGEGTSYKKLPEWEKLRGAHAEFHKAAGDIIRRADKGEKVSEEVALGANSSYAKSSSQVTMAIMEMKRKATAAA